jgi:Thioredoxin domain
MLTVKILGSGCANCKKLEAVAREAATAAQLEAEFVKVTDMQQIMAYDLLAASPPWRKSGNGSPPDGLQSVSGGACGGRRQGGGAPAPAQALTASRRRAR